MKATATSVRLAAILLPTALLALFTTYRMGRAGEWLPPLPFNIREGAWSGRDAPLCEGTLAMLGHPKAAGRIYVNPFGEWVSVSVIAADSFDAYHEPTVCSTGYGFYLKAETRPTMAGPGTTVRAMLLRNQDTGQRLILYYWLQNADGTTDTEKRMGNYRDIAARLRTGYGAIVQGQRTVLVRIFSPVPPEDVSGLTTSRNLWQVSLRLYAAMNQTLRGSSGARE